MKSASQTAVAASVLGLSTLAVAALAGGPARKPAHPYLHRTWTTEDGLPQNSVEAIVQGREGYLWIGTFGGLARFDGVDFTIYNPTNTGGLKGIRIRALHLGSDGNLWIGAEHGGLTRYRDGVFTNFSVRDGLPDDSVISLAGDRQGGLWIGTMAGLARFDGGRITSYAAQPGRHKGAVSAITQDRMGRLWLGTYKRGLICWEGGTATTYNVKDGLPSDEIWALHEDHEGSVWVGTLNGLARFRDGKIAEVVAEDGRSVGWARSFVEDPQGGLWIASWSGLFHWNGHSLTRFTKQDGLSESQVRSVFVDREDNLWIGTDGRGVNRWRKSGVVAHTAAQGLSDQAAQAIYQDRQGTIWIAIGPQVFTFRNGMFNPYPSPPHGLISLPTSLAGDQQGRVWIGDWEHGLLSLTDGRLASCSTLALPRKSIQVVHADSKGAISIGTLRDGLYQFKDGKSANYRKGEGLNDNDVSCLTEEKGVLWLGTSTGISRFADGQFTNYATEGLASVRDIHGAADGALWIGTYGYGLFRFKGGKFARITTKDGLFDDVVSAILEDNRANFWMSGNKGIFRVAQDELNAFADGRLGGVTSVSYGVQDGMDVGETNGVGYPSAWRAQDGKLWFAMIKGVVVIDPNAANGVAPPVVIEKITLGGANLPVAQPVRILPGQTNLEIHCGALSFTRPEQIKFKYKLTGTDEDWIDIGTRRTVYFRDLAPGKYTFTVIADNGEGVWNNTGTSLDIVSSPPFWRSWWFNSLGVLGLAIASLGAYHLRVARLKKAHAAQESFSRQLLASQESERQRIAAGLHDSLGQSLLIIKNRADLALAAIESREAAKEQLNEISAAALHVVEEVREIAYNLRPYHLDRFGLTKTLQNMFVQASRSCGIHFSADVDTIDGLLPRDAEINIYRIVQEALNNIIRHSQATEAEMVIRRKRRELSLRIRDNGQGFVPDTATGLGPRSGGFGLVGMAERVRMLGGACSIESGPGQGTTITISLTISGVTDEG